MRNRPGAPQARRGIWIIEAEDTEPAAVEAQVAAQLNRTSQDLTVWKDVAARFKIDIFFGWFMKVGDEGLSLSPATLTALAARNIQLEISIYSHPADWID